MKLGTAVPNFELEDINGDPVKFSEIIKEKKLIVFWASWCAHCEEMLPKLKQWQKQNPGSELEIIAISLDTSKEEWHKKVFELGIESWYNLSDLQKWEGEGTKLYNVYATPTMFLIGNNQKIIAKPLTFNDLVKVL